jgi:Fe-S-cluster-containing dehydrogenase component
MVMRLHPLFCLTVVCRFYEDALCVHACSRYALKWSSDGVIIVDEDLFIYCAAYVLSCIGSRNQRERLKKIKNIEVIT